MTPSFSRLSVVALSFITLAIQGCGLSPSEKKAGPEMRLGQFGPQASLTSRQYNGAFTMLGDWSRASRESSEGVSGMPSWLFRSFYENEYSLYSVEYWKKEIRDMERAGFDFIAPYSFGPGANYADPREWWAFPQAVLELGSPLKMAFFHDTSSDITRFNADRGVTWETRGLAVPFDLAAGDSVIKKYMYTDSLGRFFNTIPRSVWFTLGGRPVLYFWTLNGAFYANRDRAGDVIEKIRNWFIADYGVPPFIILSSDWAGADLPAATRDKVLRISDALFDWGTVENGQTFPGGGFQRFHPYTGISVSTSNPGYHYQFTEFAATAVLRHRDRRGGQTLIDDWNRGKNADIRMVAAWFDLSESSGISRSIPTAEFSDYFFIDLIRSLINGTSTGPAPPVPSGASLFEIVVTDSTSGAAIPGALVQIGGYSVTTDGNGYVGGVVPNGPYSGSISASGYQTISTTFNHDRPQRFPILLSRVGAPPAPPAPTQPGAASSLLEFIVINASNGAPVPGATVVLGPYSVTTDGNGRTSGILPNGTYPAYLSAPGFRPLSNIVDHQGEQHFTIPLVPN